MNLTNVIIYLIAGAIVGYIASRIMRTNSQQGLLLENSPPVNVPWRLGYEVGQPCFLGYLNCFFRLVFTELSTKFWDFARPPFRMVLEQQVDSGFCSEILSYPVQYRLRAALQMPWQN